MSENMSLDSSQKAAWATEFLPESHMGVSMEQDKVWEKKIPRIIFNRFWFQVAGPLLSRECSARAQVREEVAPQGAHPGEAGAPRHRGRRCAAALAPVRQGCRLTRLKAWRHVFEFNAE